MCIYRSAVISVRSFCVRAISDENIRQMAMAVCVEFAEARPYQVYTRDIRSLCDSGFQLMVPGLISNDS